MQPADDVLALARRLPRLSAGADERHDVIDRVRHARCLVPLSKTGAKLLFEVISQRYERGASLITRNLPFVMSKICILHGEWTEVFATERLIGALLDRLTHHFVRPRPSNWWRGGPHPRNERRELQARTKPHAQTHRSRLNQPAPAWP